MNQGEIKNEMKLSKCFILFFFLLLLDINFLNCKKTLEPTEVQTWEIVFNTGQSVRITVDSNGNFTGSRWVGNASSGKPKVIVTNGKMIDTTITFQANWDYSSKTEYGAGTLNISFPLATSATGVLTFTITEPQDVVGQKRIGNFSLTWIAKRL